MALSNLWAAPWQGTCCSYESAAVHVRDIKAAQRVIRWWASSGPASIVQMAYVIDADQERPGAAPQDGWHPPGRSPLMPGFRRMGGSVQFEQPGSAHAATDAHRHHYITHTAAAPLQQRMADHARAAHAERMADGDGSAVHIQAVIGDTQVIAAIQHLAGEGLVDFPQADILDLEIEALQQPGDGVHRPDAHLLRLAPGHGNPAVDAQRLETTALGLLAAHQQAGGSAVGKLRGVTGGDVLALLDPFTVLPYRRQALQAFQRGARAVALVAISGHLLMPGRFAFLVEQQLAGRQRHDFLGEQTGLLRRRSPLLALQRILVLRSE